MSDNRNGKDPIHFPGKKKSMMGYRKIMATGRLVSVCLGLKTSVYLCTCVYVILIVYDTLV